MWCKVFVSLGLLLAAYGQSTDEPIVTIAQGTVAGALSSDGSYYEFYGIPYADSASGSRRYQAPAPAPSFEGTFVANRRNVKCIRSLGVGYEGQEDCLVLDIFTPNVSDTSQLPVMVWVKGNEFNRPTEPKLRFTKFVDQGIVVVSLNFRESVFGFLCLGTETAPGNAGLKDIIAGLRWVQENIAQFGGNPDDVTLVGHGSGAAAVDLVTLSPMSEGLLHKAIAQSGVAISPWAVTRDPTKNAIAVAEALGHTITDIEQLSEVFARASVAALMGVINELDLTDNSLAFAPCVENEYLEGDEKFLLQSPYQTLVEATNRQIPIMIGYVENEGTIRTDEALNNGWLDKMDSSFNDFLQADLKFPTDVERENIANEVRNYYFQFRDISFENIDDYISYHGDTMMLVPAIKEARIRAQTSSDIYLYQFSYQGILGQPFAGVLSVVGAGHGEELGYLFNSEDNLEVSDVDATVRDIMVERWSNFVKTGQPTSEISSTVWLPVTFTETNVLLFRNNIVNGTTEPVDNTSYLDLAVVNPHSGTLAFWNEIYNDYYFEAEGVWSPTERDDVDEEVNTEATVPEDHTEVMEEIDEVEEVDPVTDSASTVVAYSLSIIALFGLLKQTQCIMLGF